MGKIDKNTLIPIGLAIAVIGGGGMWISRQELLTDANATQIVEVKSINRTISETLGKILERLSHIEGELERVPKRSLHERE